MQVKPQIITQNKEKLGLDCIYQSLTNTVVRMCYQWMKPLGTLIWRANIAGAYQERMKQFLPVQKEKG